MSAPTKILRQIAEALEQSAHPFRAENLRLAELGSQVSAPAELQPHHVLAPGVWVSFENGKGCKAEVRPAPDQDGLQIVAERGDAGWFSFSYTLPISALRQQRYLGLVLKAQGTGFTSFRPCLRYIKQDGFKDDFARQTVVITEGAQEDLVFLRIDEAALDQASALEMHFFFEVQAFDIVLHGVENLCI